MRSILRHADRDAIWRIGGEVIPFPTIAPPVIENTEIPFEELPEHDWTQHELGDDEDWAEEDAPRHIDAALPAALPTQTPFPGPKNLTDTGQKLGTHHSEVHTNPATGEDWLIKTTPKHAPFLADGDVAASAIQQYSGLHTPPTFKTTAHGKPASAQLMYPGAKDAFPNQKFDPDKLSDDDLLTIQKHHALDWLTGNHDGHVGQYIRDQQGNLIGIDKGQSFKYYNQDRLHWNFRPNEHDPIHNRLYRNFAQGGRQLNDPRQGELGQFIAHLQDIPDDEFTSTLIPYANGAATAGGLGTDFGYGPNKFEPNNPSGFLQAALQRKNNLMNDMGGLYDRAMAHRLTGTKIARTLIAMPPPVEDELENTGEQLGTHGSEVHTDPQGKWLIKKPAPGQEFLVPLETGMAQLQQRAGLVTPETYSVPYQGEVANAVKMFPGATAAFSRPPHLDELDPADLSTLQKHHALDWLTANYDAHHDNFLRTGQGDLVGIDKGQALKYFGRDRLDPNFRPIYYGPPPVHNQLWRDHARGRGELADPRQGELGDFVQNLQDIPDDEYRSMFAPYAHAAAHAGVLGTGAYTKGGTPDPHRGLSPSSIPPNDPHAFLDAMVARKNNLSNDLGNFYDQATKSRSMHQRSAPQPIAPGLAEHPADEGVHQGMIHRQGGPISDLLSMGTGLATQALTPKLPKTPATPALPSGSTPATSGETPSSAATAPGAQGAPSYSLPSGGPQPRTTPISQSPWAAMGIPIGIPSTYQHTQDQLKAMNPNLNHPTNVAGDPYGIGVGGGTSSPSSATPATTPGTTPSSSTPSTYNPSAGVEQWHPHVEEGLRRNGLPVTTDYVNRVLHQMQTESSGNPKAINNSDSNAAAGTPSKGLLQTIDPTFQSHHLPGDPNDPYDPQANIDAAIGYAKQRYGPTLMNDSGQGMGSGHGY